MKLGIFTKNFARPSLGEILDAVAGHGITHVQFNAAATLESIPTLTEAQCDDIRRNFEQRGITNTLLSATFNIIHPDEEVRQTGFEGFAVLARFARRLGTETLSISTGTRNREDMWRAHPENNSADAWRDMLEAMARIAEIAEEHEVTAAFEPEQANVIDSSKKARALLDELRSRRVKVLIDAANLLNESNVGEQDRVLKEAFELIGGEIVVAHAKEMSAGMRLGGVALGRGIVNFPMYLSLLKGVDYQGAVIMHGFAESEVSESAGYLRSLLGP